MNDAMAYVCKNCAPDSMSLPPQWTNAGKHIGLKLIPCSGKVDMQYLMHAFEGGVRGICIVTCPEGKCKLSQGNYRAQMRIATMRRLLGEVGVDPKNARIVQCEGGENADRIKEIVNETIAGFFNPSPTVSSYL